MRSKLVITSFLLGMFASCAEGTPTLDFTAEAPTMNGAIVSTKLHLIATAGDGTVGAGTVTLTATNGGMLESSSVTLDKFGTAVVALSCDTATAACAMSSVQVEGTWTVKGKPITGLINVNLRPVAGTGGGAGSDGGTGGGGVDYSDAGCPVFIMNGRRGVINGPVRFDSSNARFAIYDSFMVFPPDFRTLQGGRGVMIELTLPPVYESGRGWNVFLLHTVPGMTGQFMLGPYIPVSDGDGTGTRIQGVDTVCTSFAGDRFDVKELTLRSDGTVSHIAAELWAHCPNFGGNPQPSDSRGYICF